MVGWQVRCLGVVCSCDEKRPLGSEPGQASADICKVWAGQSSPRRGGCARLVRGGRGPCHRRQAARPAPCPPEGDSDPRHRPFVRKTLAHTRQQWPRLLTTQTQIWAVKSPLDAHVRMQALRPIEWQFYRPRMPGLVGGPRVRPALHARGAPPYGALPTSHLIDHPDGRCEHAPELDESDEGNGL